MEFELRNKELKNCVTCDTIEIQIGIKIGKQMERDSNEKIELKTNKI